MAQLNRIDDAESCSQSQSRDKRQVAASFSRAAGSYDSAAQLQRDIGSELLSRLPVGVEPKRILDLGCGTGYFSELLQRRFPSAEIICLDLAEGMLKYARAERLTGAGYLCADAEALPLQTGSIDLIFSSLAIQWCESLPALFSELQRVLNKNGCAHIATLGPRTLSELRSAWQQVDDYVHVNQFAPLASIKAAAANTGYAEFSVEAVDRVLQYEKLQQLTRELKAIGAHNVNRGQNHGLSGRARIEKFRAAYETFRRDGKLPATYEIYYLSLIK